VSRIKIPHDGRNVYVFRVGYRVENVIASVVAHTQEEAEDLLQKEIDVQPHKGNVADFWVTDVEELPGN